MDTKKISREAILREAMGLLREVGLDRLSLRLVAERVGIRAPSLYWYFKDKTALLDGLQEAIFAGCLDRVPDHCHWRDWMRAFGRVLLDTQRQIPDFGRLGTSRDMDDALFGRTVERIRGKLEQLDMPFDEAVKLQSAIQALTTGWSAFANAPYSAKLSTLFEPHEAAARSLDALIEGWSLPGPG